MIRLRGCAPTGFRRRRRYQAELLDPDTGVTLWRKETTTPVTFIDPYIGVAEAWALVHSVDSAWDHNSAGWVSLPGSVQ
jgi:hypothetical protein